MRFLNTAKLGLVLITVLVALVAAAAARADQSPSSTTPDAPASPSAVAVPSVPSTPPTSPSPAIPPAAAPTATNPAADTTAPPADTTAPPADTTAPPADTTDTTAPPADTTSSTERPAPSDTTEPTDTTEPPTPPAPPTRTAPPATPPTPPTSPAPATPPTPPTPPASPNPPPAPVASSTTTQTIIQIQISGCTSNCQGVSQVQQATQTTGYLQTAGASAQQASQLEAPAPATASQQPTITITQVQIGCLTQCLGTTTTGTAPQPVAQQILAALSSLVPPTASTGPRPSPGIDQAVIDQVSCQLQTGGPATGTEVQTATQTSTTVQLIDPSAKSEPASVNQTDQQTWQLQIGCLFYCTDTEQVQQAQQAITTIQILVGDPESTSTTSTPGADGAASQLIWQLQIGCIAWCYDATQVQSATTQTTVTVITLVPPATPSPPSPPPADITGDSPTAPVETAASTPSTPTTVVQAAASTPLWWTTARAGIAILDYRPPKPGVVAQAPVRSGFSVPTVVLPASGRDLPTPQRAFVADSARSSSAHPHRDLRALGGGESLATASLGAAATRPSWIRSILVIALGLVAAAALWAFGTGHHVGRRR